MQKRLGSDHLYGIGQKRVAAKTSCHRLSHLNTVITCKGFLIPVCLCVCVGLCIKLQGLSLALRSHDQFEASHWMMDDGWRMMDNGCNMSEKYALLTEGSKSRRIFLSSVLSPPLSAISAFPQPPLLLLLSCNFCYYI